MGSARPRRRRRLIPQRSASPAVIPCRCSRVHLTPSYQVATPAAIPVPSSVAAAAGGSHSIVCARDGSLWAFGRALHGRLGLGGGGQSVHRPTQLKLPGGFLCCDVAAGGFGSAALTRDGQVLTWGASQNGELGRNTFDNSNVPQPVHGLHGVRIVQISLGGFHALGLDDQGRVWGWGFNGSMQLGVKGKKVVAQAELLPLPSHAPAVRVAAGGAHSLVALADGRCCSTGTCPSPPVRASSALTKLFFQLVVQRQQHGWPAGVVAVC
jgi:alpha-tubulin suppressor-like RCC1 family protein